MGLTGVHSGLALKRGYSPDAAVPELNVLQSVLSINTDEAKTMLEEFIRADKDKSGRLSSEEFIAHFKGPSYLRMTAEQKRTHKQQLRYIFSLLDANDRGELDFRDFVLGLSIIQGKHVKGSEATVRLAFRAFANGADTISAATFAMVVRRAFPGASDESVIAAYDEARAGRDAISEDAFVEYARAHTDLIDDYRRILLGITSATHEADIADKVTPTPVVVAATPADQAPVAAEHAPATTDESPAAPSPIAEETPAALPAEESAPAEAAVAAATAAAADELATPAATAAAAPVAAAVDADESPAALP